MEFGFVALKNQQELADADNAPTAAAAMETPISSLLTCGRQNGQTAPTWTRSNWKIRGVDYLQGFK